MINPLPQGHKLGIYNLVTVQNPILCLFHNIKSSDLWLFIDDFVLFYPWITDKCTY